MKVSGRKGLGVKADDLIDALVDKARGRDRGPRPGARPTRRASATARDDRHRRPALLPAEVRPHQDHHLRHGRGAGLHRRDRALRPERRRARAQHLRQARGGGPRRRAALLARARDAGPRRPARRRGRRRGLGAAAADGAQRRGRGAGGARGGGGAPGQARLRGGPGLPLVLPEAALLGAPRGERGPARLPGAGGGRVRAPDGRASPPCSASRSRSACEAPAHRRHRRASRKTGPRGLRRCATTTCARSRRRAGLPLVLAPGPAWPTRPSCSAASTACCSAAAPTSIPRTTARSPTHTVAGVSPERDAFELALCREALARDLPLLAICRGHQVLNVATGGTLVQDIPSQVGGAVDHDPEDGALGARPRREDLARDASSGDPGEGQGRGEQLPPSVGQDARAGTGRLRLRGAATT